jgi:LacI family transcriptional regulator
MKITLKDIALEAGVSQATVSQALCGKGRIAQETKERIYSAAEKLNYRIRPRAAHSENEERDNVGILLLVDPKWSFIWGFIRPIVVSIEKVMMERGFNTILIPIEADQSTRDILQKILVAGVKAVFSIHYGSIPLFEKLESFHIPVVIIMNNNYQDRFYTVGVDDFQGSYEGALYLLKLGHRKIAYIESERSEVPVLLPDRFIGFRKAMDEAGVAFAPGQRIHVNLGNIEEMETKLQRLFKEVFVPTAIFALDDDVALRIVYALENLGLAVPADISLICPGDVLDYTQPNVPKLTTMSIDTSYMGKIAADMMLNRLCNDPEDIHVLKIKQQLVLRGSCRTADCLAPSKEL